jgi:hypothetical protein
MYQYPIQSITINNIGVEELNKSKEGEKSCPVCGLKQNQRKDTWLECQTLSRPIF